MNRRGSPDKYRGNFSKHPSSFRLVVYQREKLQSSFRNASGEWHAEDTEFYRWTADLYIIHNSQCIIMNCELWIKVSEWILKDGWSFYHWYSGCLKLWRIFRTKLPERRRRRKRYAFYPVDVTFVKPHVIRLPSRRPTAICTRRPTVRGSATPITQSNRRPTAWVSGTLFFPP